MNDDSKVLNCCDTLETVNISLDEYKKLLEDSVRLKIITQSIKDRVDEGRACVNTVDPYLVRIITNTMYYISDEWKEQADAVE